MIDESTRQIPLSQGKFALVDAVDYEWLNQLKWCYQFHGYAIRREYYLSINGKKASKQIQMHRLLMKFPEGKEIDHINGNGIDNRRSNLRICSHNQNCKNRKKQKNAQTSIYKGVTKERGKYRADICINGCNKFLGYFPSEIEAAQKYDNAAIQYHEQFARINNAPISSISN